MAMTEEERKKIAGDAVRRALIERAREDRNWQIRIASDSGLRDAMYGETFIESPDFGRRSIEDFIAELMVDRDEWKRRAAKHGCNVDDGDPDCA